jgi:hypothetical protein
VREEADCIQFLFHKATVILFITDYFGPQFYICNNSLFRNITVEILSKLLGMRRRKNIIEIYLKINGFQGSGLSSTEK